eukprot:gene7210-biopygen13535
MSSAKQIIPTSQVLVQQRVRPLRPPRRRRVDFVVQPRQVAAGPRPRPRLLQHSAPLAEASEPLGGGDWRRRVNRLAEALGGGDWRRRVSRFENGAGGGVGRADPPPCLLTHPPVRRGAGRRRSRLGSGRRGRRCGGARRRRAPAARARTSTPPPPRPRRAARPPATPSPLGLGCGDSA